jgi:DNA-binding NtrC family response regulator
MTERILLVDDQRDILDHLAKVLRERRYDVLVAGSGEDAVDLARREKERLDAIVLDLDLAPGKLEGAAAVQLLRQAAPEVPIVALSGKGTTLDAVKVLKLGVVDLVEKGLYVEEALPVSLQRVRAVARVLQENRQLRRDLQALQARREVQRAGARERNRIVGDSPSIRKVLEDVRLAAPGSSPVLLRGERGTGKELIAAALHERSDRPEGPFVAVNCAALPGSLLERELFGYERGAFPGADARRLGRIEQAHGGTLYLGDVGYLTGELQERLMRVLDAGEILRLGGGERVKVDLRLVAGSVADLEARIESGAFRRDLFDLLAQRVIRVPPLRDRAEDVARLADHFAEGMRQKVGWTEPRTFAPEVLERFRLHSWPGNVRELRAVVERMVIGCPERTIRLRDVPVELLGPGAGTLPQQLEALERALVERALERWTGNRERAAESLGLTLAELDARSERY